MSQILVFDVNETLLDVHALAPQFERLFGDSKVLQEWFSLLLLHSEAATLAGPYFDFGTIAGAALQMISATRGIAVADSEKQELVEGMMNLPPHPEAKEALLRLQNAGFQMVTLTNSSPKAVEQQLKNSGLQIFFDRNFSVDSVQRYKPAPEPYRMVASELGVETARLLLVAAHAWDVLGAMRVGCSAAFIARPGKTLFPLVDPPSIMAPNLLGFVDQLLANQSSSNAR